MDDLRSAAAERSRLPGDPRAAGAGGDDGAELQGGPTLYTLPEMQRADAMIAETFRRACPRQVRCNLYPGGHKFDRAMQADAFAWFDRFLKPKQ